MAQLYIGRQAQRIGLTGLFIRPVQGFYN